jgi:serine/threonine-protein kinase
MGEVYRARDPKLQREVAIKVLPEHLAADRDRLARFDREAQLLASLNHPHIAHIYGFEESGSTRALVLELVEGETLADRIAQGPIPFDEAVPIARQIAQALEAAHEQGIVHRDLKPANVKITPAGMVKVLDFGLAKLTDSSSASGSVSSMSISPTLTSPAMATGVGAILGTATYMAPEQARGRSADKRSDVWAFGCVLYEMLTGRRAFQGEDITDTLASILKSQPDWTALPADVPPAVRTLLQRCLDKDRASRAGDIAVAKFALEEARTLGGFSGGAIESAASATRARSAWPRALAAAGLAAAVCAAIAAAAMWWLSQAAAARVSRFEIMPLATEPLAAPPGVNVALSPDGSALVYHAQAGGVPQLYMRRIGELDAVPIRGTELGINPAISPDGTRLVFTTPTQMKMLSLAGGPPSVIAELQGEVQGATWSGDAVVFGLAGAGLFRVPAAGGRPENIAKPDQAKQETDYRWPVAVPGTDVILYTVYGVGGPRQARIVARRLESGTTRVLVEGGNNPLYTPSGHLVYATVPATLMAAPFDLDTLSLTGTAVPVLEGFAVVKGTGAINLAVAADGTLAYVRGAGGVFQGGTGFQWVSRGGKTLGSVASNVDGPRYPRISPDGRWLVVTIGQANQGQIWVIDLTGASQPRQLTFKGHNVMPVWSADGKSIAFTSDRDGQRNLFRIAADGSELEPRALATSRHEQSPSAWSVDGESLLYEESFAARGDLSILSVRNGSSTPWLRTQFDESDASISPDGKWVSYVTDQTGRPEVWVRPFPGPGAPLRVSADGGREPIWSRSGSELFYQSGRKMMAAEVVSRGTTIEFTRPTVLFEGGFVPNESNVPRTYDVARDGRFLMIQEAPLTRPTSIVLVLNWFEELKRRVP